MLEYEISWYLPCYPDPRKLLMGVVRAFNAKQRGCLRWQMARGKHYSLTTYSDR